jgi:hypothetical protein
MTFHSKLGLCILIVMINLSCANSKKGGAIVGNGTLNPQYSFLPPKINKYYVQQNKDFNSNMSILEFSVDSIKIYDFTTSLLSFSTGMYVFNSGVVTAIIDENFIISLNTGATLSVRLNCSDVIDFIILNQDSLTKYIPVNKRRSVSDKINLNPIDSNMVYTMRDSIIEDISWVQNRRNFINIKEDQIIDCLKQK